MRHSPAATALAPFRFKRRDPWPDDVVIDILYCGVCHSDLHAVKGKWGGTVYPCTYGRGFQDRHHITVCYKRRRCRWLILDFGSNFGSKTAF